MGYTRAVVSTRLHIARGSRGPEVRDLKARLGGLGYHLPAGEALDELGTETEALIRSFQAARGLRVDGICGPQTWSALVESGYALGDRLLYHRQPMLRGDDVAALQGALNALGFDAGKEDGIFGPDTVAAVREFQRNAGITVEGICGPETVAALGRLGRSRDGSVARARERAALRGEGRDLAHRRVLLAVAPGLEAIAEVVRHGLADQNADVVVETATDDQSTLAAEANAFGADLVLLLRLGDRPGITCAHYESGAYRSEQGHRVASALLDALRGVLPDPAPTEPQGRTYSILRETRAPAVVCEPAADGDVDAVRTLVARGGPAGRAIVGAIRRAVEEPLEE